MEADHSRESRKKGLGFVGSKLKFAGDESDFGGFDAFLGLAGAGSWTLTRVWTGLGCGGCADKGQG